VTVIDGDVRDIAVIPDGISAGIDLSKLACLLMGALLHFFPPDAAHDLVAGFFGPLTLVAPGVVDAREWHPDGGQTAPPPPRPGQALGGVARVG
jgi:hypothetical protein